MTDASPSACRRPEDSSRRVRKRYGAAAVAALVVIGAVALWWAAGRVSPEAAFDEEATALVHTEGQASFYGRDLAGEPTASGEPFDPQALTAAHRTLPLDTRVRVTNLHNGRSVTVRINDRGPYVRPRIIDLSRRAAREIGMIERGEARVRLKVVGR